MAHADLRLWVKFKTALKILNDNNYTARKLYDYVNKNYKPMPKKKKKTKPRTEH